MFGLLYKLAENVKRLQVNEIAVSVFILPKVKQFIIRLNQFEQLFEQGIDVNDNIIGVYSIHNASETISGQQQWTFNGVTKTKEPGTPYTLYDTGEFYASFTVIVNADSFVIRANTEKPDSDLSKFGEILGLTPESKNELSKQMLPLVIEAVRKKMLN